MLVQHWFNIFEMLVQYIFNKILNGSLTALMSFIDKLFIHLSEEI